MASPTYRLVMNFADAGGNSVTFSYNFAKSPTEMDGTRVKGLKEALIANGSIFKNVPATFKDAYIVETTKTQVSAE